MKDTCKPLTVFNRIILFLLAVAAGIVLVTSVFTTIYYDMHMDVDWPHYGRENIPVLVLSLIVALGLMYLLYRTKAYLANNRLMALALVLIAAYCLTLILAITPQAVNDSKTIDDCINQFAEGDYSSLTGIGYLFIWPFQLGYVAFGQVMYHFFGPSNYLAWDIVQLISILITMFLIYRMADEMFDDKKIVGITCVLSLGALFFYNYVTYIYGDILSMAPQTLALYLMIRYLKKDSIGYAVGSAAAIAVAVVIKTNCEITLIALLMMLFIKEIPRRIPRAVALTAIFLFFVFGAKAAVNAYFCNLTGLDKIPEGSPSVSHIVMGLQESDLEDGWYNGYNYAVFGDNHYDVEATKAAAIQDLKDRLSFFASHPKYTVKFFLRKFTTQWADPVCISTHNLDLVSRHVDNQPALCDFLVFGTGSMILAQVMNVFMTLCYLGVVIFLVRAFRKGDATQPQMLLLILIFGGILFHEFWEGSSRYAMRYYIYWLPYAAAGLEVIFGHFFKHNKI